jgi:hypothetical protein
VNLNATYSAVTFTNSFTFQTLCLGERSFGGPLKVQLTPLLDGCGTNDYDVFIDRAEILPLATCPLLGEIPNAKFDVAGTWITTNSGGGTAAIAPQQGVGGSGGGQLTGAMGCDRPSIRGAVSIPAASVPNTALKVSYKSGSLTRTDVTVNGMVVGELGPQTNFGTGTICMPEWAKGGVQELGFTFPRYQQTCNTAYQRSFTVDDLSWVSDATCAADARILDPGFERIDVARAWSLVTDSFGGDVARTSDAAVAKTGSGALRLDAFKACGGAWATTSITVPAPVGAAGPAVKFWYKAPVINSGTAFSTSPGTTLPATGSYTQAKVCLDPRRIGQSQLLTFSSRVLGVCTTASFPTQSAWFDDIEVTTDASCPAQ